MQTVIATDRLTFGYNSAAVVRTISMSIGEGMIYGFVGPNGAGKSTTIKLLLGLLTPKSGTIEIFGSDLRGHRTDILRMIGSLVETPSLYPHLTGEENLEAVRKAFDVPKSRIDKVLTDAAIIDAKKKKVKEYSLGMKQRLGIAMSLLHSPKLLILDEPINGLDPEGIQEFRGFLKRLAAEEGVTVLLSSHILSELEQVVTDVGIIARGTLRFQGSLDELKRRQQGKLIIRVTDSLQAQHVLQQKKISSLRYGDSGIVVPVTDDRTAAAINAALVAEKIDVFEMKFEQPNLESVFLEIIQTEMPA